MVTSEKQVLTYIDQHQSDLFTLLGRLIQFDTQNLMTHGREKECQYYLADLYRAIGLATDIYSPDDIPYIKEHPAYLPGRGLEDRPNVTGILYGKDRQSQVMIAAHTDTMPVGDPGKWTFNPFGGTIQDGFIYGLGAGDNKSGLAAGFFALKALQACGIKLDRTVLLTAYVDEEYGGGNGTLAACLKYPCQTYVNLDGGNYELWICALGGGGFEIEIKAISPTDTSSPTVDMLCRIKSEVEAMGRRRQTELHHNRLYAGSDMERSAFRLMQFSAGGLGSDLDSGRLSFVIYTVRTKEEIERELTDIIDGIRPVLAKNGYSIKGFKPITRFFHYMEMPENDPAAAIFAEAARDSAGNGEVRRCGACLSDLSLFLGYGSKSSFSFGILRDFSLPGGAHQPDEYVSCKQMIEYTQAIALFLIRYCGLANE
jgi:acetylornithine deacetylase